jgi:hypothetical protein
MQHGIAAHPVDVQIHQMYLTDQRRTAVRR